MYEDLYAWTTRSTQDLIRKVRPIYYVFYDECKAQVFTHYKSLMRKLDDVWPRTITGEHMAMLQTCAHMQHMVVIEDLLWKLIYVDTLDYINIDFIITSIDEACDHACK